MGAFIPYNNRPQILWQEKTLFCVLVNYLTGCIENFETGCFKVRGSALEYNKLLIILTTSPAAGIKHFSAIRFAERARHAGKEVKLVCVADGVLCMKRELDNPSQFNFDTEFRVRQVIEQGARVMVCKKPMQLLGISDADLIEGVEIIDDVFSLLVKKDVRVVWL
jgi:predicted peroxiredoxin